MYTRYPSVILYQIYIIMYIHTFIDVLYTYMHSVCGIIYETITTIPRPSPDEQKGPKLREYTCYISNISRAGVIIITIIIIVIITFQRCHYVIRTRYHRYFWTNNICGGSPPTKVGDCEHAGVFVPISNKNSKKEILNAFFPVSTERIHFLKQKC